MQYNQSLAVFSRRGSAFVPTRSPLGQRAASKRKPVRPRMSWLWTFGSVPELTPTEVQQLSEKIAKLTPEERTSPRAPRIIDVRTQGEYEGGHIEGAVNASFLPPWSFPQRIKPLLEGLTPDTPMLLVCLSAHRSIGALKWLSKEGYTQCHQLQGGMQAWRAAGLPEVPKPAS